MSKEIKITTAESHSPLDGKSKWWGAPDMPEDMPYPYVMVLGDDNEQYPEPLTFICQIRLEDIADYDHDNLLPHEGMLYFFAAIDHFLQMESPLELPLHEYSGEMVRVLYSPTTDGLKPYELNWEDTGESVFRPAEQMMFGHEGESICHAMLGSPRDNEVNERQEKMVQLLRIEEDDNWNLRFYDCGSMYFLISRHNLAKRRFDRVETEVFFY